MDAIILAGGQGTRLRSVVAELPKPLAPVNGRPFLDLLLSQLAASRAVDSVVLAIGYKADLIEDRYRDCRDFGFPIAFSVEDTPLGTGGALYKALRLTSSRNVLVMNGDSYVDVDLQALASAHATTGATITMVVTEVDDTGRFGSVQIDPASGRVIGFAEKAESRGRGFINAGCYLLARQAFESARLEPLSFERDVLPGFLTATFAHVTAGRFIDIGIPESYAQAPRYLRDG